MDAARLAAISNRGAKRRSVSVPVAKVHAALYLRAAGEATMDLRGARSRIRPRELDGPERDRAWRALIAAYPAAEHYEGFTDRRFPVIALEPGRAA